MQTDESLAPELRAVSGANGPRVLVVDDDPVARAFACTVLKGVGYDVAEAGDGPAALDVLRRSPFQLVVLDNRMPGLSGIDVVRRIRARLATRTLPVLLLTAADGVSDRVAGLEAGADDYVVKPVDPQELVARVGAQLRGQDAWQRVVRARLEERAALARIVRAAGHAQAVEHAADVLVSGLTTSSVCAGAALLAFTAGGTIEVISSSSCGDLPARTLLDEAQCSRFRDIAESGAAADRAAGSVTAPLRYGPSTLGLLVLRDADDLDGLLATAIDLAEMTSGLLGSRLERRLTDNELQRRLSRLIELRALRAHYQPIVDLTTDEVVGVEALARFDDGVPPLTRLREAAAAGMSLALEHAMVDAAVAEVAELPEQTWVSVNVSPGLLVEDGERLRDAVQTSERPVVLELSEQDAVSDYDVLRSAVGRVGRGVRLSVDDAGAGFASLHHILELAPEFVKLDRSWVKDVDQDPARQSLIAGLQHFADTTGSQLIAEGVERPEERAQLESLGVRLAQGYLLGRPAPVSVSRSIDSELMQ